MDTLYINLAIAENMKYENRTNHKIMCSHTLKLDQVVCCKKFLSITEYIYKPFRYFLPNMLVPVKISSRNVLALAHYNYNNNFSKFQLARHNTRY